MRKLFATSLAGALSLVATTSSAEVFNYTINLSGLAQIDSGQRLFETPISIYLTGESSDLRPNPYVLPIRTAAIGLSTGLYEVTNKVEFRTGADGFYLAFDQTYDNGVNATSPALIGYNYISPLSQTPLTLAWSGVAGFQKNGKVVQFVVPENRGLTFSVERAVPEPSTWMMMILGFGVIGYALRRKTVLRYA
ncbi:PEPxxWA-CTERM sorting domain-containing protein [Sphingomonas phyllosphaerae]|uniref:PEPxxWA-CTERM sorting domain-containing protein n=1 Tax=Sphingomonas phyllosphaerae TaxID=257003 RepID=UPI0024136927|nr:PEPxxWA-CTERM sorting domain-containing protein [Sphingomonas phyllosphaerae]